jgi:hypothetical protein
MSKEEVELKTRLCFFEKKMIQNVNILILIIINHDGLNYIIINIIFTN